VSVWGWILVGLAVWLVVAVGLALVVAHFVRSDRVTTLDLLRAREGGDAAPVERPEEPETDTHLPAPRDGAHDGAAAASRRRRRDS
jgi:hypothetical protein